MYIAQNCRFFGYFYVLYIRKAKTSLISISVCLSVCLCVCLSVCHGPEGILRGYLLKNENTYRDLTNLSLMKTLLTKSLAIKN
jgi:hypothetical protein